MDPQFFQNVAPERSQGHQRGAQEAQDARQSLVRFGFKIGLMNLRISVVTQAALAGQPEPSFNEFNEFNEFNDPCHQPAWH